LDNKNTGKSKKAKKIADVQPAMNRDPQVQGELLTRLKKIEGQVRGVQKMIQETRDCGEIVTQLAAIKSAVNRVSITVLACHLADELKNDLQERRDLKETLGGFMKVFKKFS
jgi:DNA-binding FrmR family transcriptional regulator